MQSPVQSGPRLNAHNKIKMKRQHLHADDGVWMEKQNETKYRKAPVVLLLCRSCPVGKFRKEFRRTFECRCRWLSGCFPNNLSSSSSGGGGGGGGRGGRGGRGGAMEMGTAHHGNANAVSMYALQHYHAAGPNANGAIHRPTALHLHHQVNHHHHPRGPLTATTAFGAALLSAAPTTAAVAGLSVIPSSAAVYPLRQCHSQHRRSGPTSTTTVTRGGTITSSQFISTTPA